MGRPIGVSGNLSKVVEWRREQASAALMGALQADPEALQAELLRATVAQFGAEALAALPAAPAPAAPLPARRITPESGLTFLFMCIVGAATSAWLRGGWTLTVDPSAAFAHLMGSG